MVKRVLLTGSCGFIGHHVIEHLLKNTDWEIVGLDKLSYASHGFERLRDIGCMDFNRVKIFTCDLRQPIQDFLAQEIGHIDYVLHLAANTHVDKSITEPLEFLLDNTLGTVNLLEYLRIHLDIEKFIYFSTDECFGPAPVGVNHKEGDRHNPSNPYSASKGSAEDFCVAYANTYKLPLIITSTMNVVGERQDKEKFVPLVINNVLNDRVTYIHSNKNKTVSGSRFYIHARNVADALLFILTNTNEFLDIDDKSSGRFNIVGDKEITNLDLAKLIATTLGKELKYEMIDFHSSRPGHDLRYALDGGKLQRLGFAYKKTIEESIKKIIEWTLLPENVKWLK